MSAKKNRKLEEKKNYINSKKYHKLHPNPSYLDPATSTTTARANSNNKPR